MSVLDLSVERNEAVGELGGRVGLRRPGGAEAAGRADVDVDLVFPIGDEAGARVADATVPGALALWARSQEARDAGATEETIGGAADGAEAASRGGTYGQTRVRLPHRDFRWTLRNEDEAEGYQIILDVEVLAVTVKVTPKAVAMTVKARAERVLPAAVANLVELLGAANVRVACERRGQLALALGAAAPAPEVGQVASGVHDGVEFAGLVVGHVRDEDHGDMLEVDDLGTRLLVPVPAVSGVLRVVGNGVPLDRALDKYQRACHRKGVDGTWRDLVPVLGAHYLAAGTPATEDWPLTDGLVREAVARTTGPQA